MRAITKGRDSDDRNDVARRRRTSKYYFKVGHKIRHAGITTDLERREREHQQRWPSGHICKVGNVTTGEAARQWEEQQMNVSRERRRKVYKGR
jgi:predicted GIY-YIG superfamily endonuclease